MLTPNLYTFLHYAVLHGNLEGVQQILPLIDKDLVNAKHKFGDTALHMAAAISDPDSAYLMVEAIVQSGIVAVNIKARPIDHQIRTKKLIFLTTS